MLRLFRFTDRKSVPSIPQNGGPQARAGSPPGGSTLMTFAPRSPRIYAQYGPARFCVTSQIERSDRGSIKRRPFQSRAYCGWGPRAAQTARRLQSRNASEGLLSEGMGLYVYASIQYYYGSVFPILTAGEVR